MGSVVLIGTGDKKYWGLGRNKGEIIEMWKVRRKGKESVLETYDDAQIPEEWR